MCLLWYVMMYCVDSGCLCFDLFFFSSRRRHTRCAVVTGVQTCALPIYVELVAALVDHLEEIVRRTGGVQGLQPLVAADAVVDVVHHVLRLQVGDLGEEVLGTAPALRRTREDRKSVV